MGVSPVYLLMLWALQCKTNESVCEDGNPVENLFTLSNLEEPIEIADIDANKNFSCFLYPSNTLNCSWAFESLQENEQLSVSIRICTGNHTVYPQNIKSKDIVGAWSVDLNVEEISIVCLYFNVSFNGTWMVYAYKYDADMLEVLSPPGNISASFSDAGLQVTWDRPPSRAQNSWCFEYQLDFGGKEQHVTVTKQSYIMNTADLTSSYTVRIRAKKKSVCLGSPEWSAWSHTVTVKPSTPPLNTLLIASISLGLPSILLALLLLVRHTRVSKVLFPPVPHPPLKYKHILEKHDGINYYISVPAVKCEEEITKVQEIVPNPEATVEKI